MNKSDYPFLKNEMTPELVKELFRNLQNYKAEFVHLPLGSYWVHNIPGLNQVELSYLESMDQIILKMQSGDWYKYNMITMYFSEVCQIKARRFDENLSPEEYWDKYKKNIINETKSRVKNYTNKDLSDTMYQSLIGAGLFRVSLMAAFIDFFRAKNILDFSSGWGDRLIGSLSRNVESYTGCDPNNCLHKQSYPEIIKFFKENFPEIKTRINMIQSPFEQAELDPDLKVDLIFTSPPYFILEIYSDDPGQSIKNYTDLDSWYNNFLIFSIKKAWKYLIPGGHLCINITDISGRNLDKKNYHYVEKMIQDINYFPDSKYLGLISNSKFTDNEWRSPQPFWIWTKIVLDLDPGIQIQKIDKFQLISDHELIAGTKQRGIRFLEKDNNPAYQFLGGLNLSLIYHTISSKLARKPIYFKLIEGMKIPKIIFKARQWGLMFRIPDKSRLEIVPNPETNQILENLIFENLKKNGLSINKPIWFAESEILSRVFKRLFPNTDLNMVLICNKNKIIENKIKIWNSPDSCGKPAELISPFGADPLWDMKIWKIVKQSGSTGDFIWIGA